MPRPTRYLNVGYVEDVLALDVRALKKAKLLVEGSAQSFTLAGFFMSVDMTDVSNAFVHIADNQQRIPLVSRPMPFGGKRWFFLDDKLQNAEVLVLSGNRFVSRKTALLTYRSQSMSDRAALIAKRQKLEVRRDMIMGRTTAQLRKKNLLSDQIEEIEELQAESNARAARRELARRQRIQENRARSVDRLLDAKYLMDQRVELRENDVAKLFSTRVAEWREKARDYDPTLLPWKNIEPTPDADAYPSVDINVFARLGFLQRGKLTGRHVAWSADMLPDPKTKIFVLFDLRRTSKACAVIVQQNGKRLRGLFFWLKRKAGKLNRTPYQFQCPCSGLQSDRLIFVDGDFRHDVQFVDLGSHETGSPVY